MRIAAFWNRHEGPTWAVAFILYAAWGLLTWFYQALPLWFAAPAGAWLVAWHGSFQHETIHGHPTKSPPINEALAFPALGLFFPYRLYRKSHLRHHNDERLTFPFEDPESYYVPQQHWNAMGPWRKRLLLFYNTLLGRLAIGPLMSVSSMIADEIRHIRNGDTTRVKDWALHVPASALVLIWTGPVCGIPFLSYLAFFAYPGLSLVMLRSFAEHRAVENVGERTVIVRTTPWMRLLYLNNNFHSVHHDYPRLPWYKIPARYRAHQERFLNANGHYFFSSYGEQFRRFLFRPKEMPVHPQARG